MLHAAHTKLCLMWHTEVMPHAAQKLCLMQYTQVIPQEELFKLRLELANKKKTPPWKMLDLEDALRKLKDGKCRDPDRLIREIFKEEVIGTDLKLSMLKMYNKMKSTGTIPSFMKFINISSFYKGRGEVTDLESERGIFLVIIFITILMKMLYKDKYDVIEEILK